MTTYRMTDDGYPFKKIMQGRKWVGRVVKHASGGFLATINRKPPITAQGATEADAFKAAAAKALGYDSPEQVYAHNAAVRHRNKVQRAYARYAVDQALNHGNFDPFYKTLGEAK
jgi:hypothetical protein